MNESLQVVTFVLAVLNIIPLAITIYKNKRNLALGFAFLEILLVALYSVW